MDAILNTLAQLQPQHWLALAFILLIAEMMTGTTYLLWPAVAAGITGLVAFIPSVPWQAEVALFALLVIVLTAFGKPLVRNRLLHAPTTQINERAAELVGVRGAAAGDFVNGLGSVRINDSVWRAKSAAPVAAGAPVEVLSVEGVTLTVKPAA